MQVRIRKRVLEGQVMILTLKILKPNLSQARKVEKVPKTITRKLKAKEMELTIEICSGKTALEETALLKEMTLKKRILEVM